MQGIVMAGVRTSMLTALIGVGGPLETGNVDLVLSTREGPITEDDVYDAAFVAASAGLAPVVGIAMRGPYLNPAGEEVVSGPCHPYLSTGIVDPPETVNQWWIVSQDVAPVLLAAGMLEPAVPITAAGIGFDVETEVNPF